MDLFDASVGLRIRAAEAAEAAPALRARLGVESEEPGVHLGLGLFAYADISFPESRSHLEAAFHGFKALGEPNRAAVAAAHLGRLHHDGIGNVALANGWFARAESLIGDRDCVERGWVLLGRVGCTFESADDLFERATQALALSRRFGDADLECKALADLGLATVELGDVGRGLARLDEAMTMSTSGECDNVFITGQVYCCLISACERCGDLARMESWLDTLAEFGFLDPARKPSMTYAHCQSEYGALLCHAGRWAEAETMLRLAVATSEQSLRFHRVESRAALADLRIHQGRLDDATRLLVGFEERIEAQTALARLRLARGDADAARVIARDALRRLRGDLLRSAPLLGVLVEAALARDDVATAAAAADELSEAARRCPSKHVHGQSALATGLVMSAQGDHEAARTAVEGGLATLGHEWPLLAADLELAIAGLPTTDSATAVAAARRAATALDRLGAARASRARQVLEAHGVELPPAAAAGDLVGQLTPREREVLRLVSRGLSNPEIAAELVISPKTAEHHVGNVLRKLHLRSRSEAAAYAATLSL